MASRLTAEPDSDDRAVAEALCTINQLHQMTGRVELVNEDHLRRWVDAPLAQLRESCRVLTPGLLGAVHGLGASLRDALVGRGMLVSWTHGDFTPANVLVSGPNSHVTGIVDWGGARPGRPSLLDTYLLLLCVSCYREGRELGAMVPRLIRAGGLPGRERDLLAEVRVQRAGEPPQDEVDERALVLLAWLHHVAELRRKCDLYRENAVWWALHGEPVLRVVARLPQKVGPE